MAKVNFPTKVFRKGFAAFVAGKTSKANPYRPGTSDAAEWKRGWMEAYRAHFIDGVTW